MSRAVRNSSKSKSGKGSTKGNRVSRKRKSPKTSPRAKKAKDQDSGPSVARESFVLLKVLTAIFLCLALISHALILQAAESSLGIQKNWMGPIGRSVAEMLFNALGWCSFAIVVWVLLLARSSWLRAFGGAHNSFLRTSLRTVSATLALLAAATMASVVFGASGGGAVGSHLAFSLVAKFNNAGTFLLSLGVMLFALGIGTGFGFQQILQVFLWCGRVCGDVVADIGYFFYSLVAGVFGGLGAVLRRSMQLFLELFFSLGSLCKRAGSEMLQRWEEQWEEDEEEEALPKVTTSSSKRNSNTFVLDDEPESRRQREADEASDTASGQRNELKISRRDAQALREKSRGKSAPKAEKEVELQKSSKNTFEDYKLPPSDLLVSGEVPNVSGPEDADLIENSSRLEQALLNFKLGGRVVEVHPGPVVTLYEFEPAAGVKVQRVINLADDLALALRVGSVRVYAPVPGKGTVGIEVPNSQREIVRLRDILESDDFIRKEAPLPLALGKDTFGEAVVADLAKMPHLLIAGATGTGKSVCINSLLTSLLYRNSPANLQLILIDPKMLELSMYEDIPHLKAPVVTQARRARGVLWWAVEEMERRYGLMKEMGVRDLSMYNRAVGGNGGRSSRRGKKKQNVVITLEEKDVIATGSPYEGLDRLASSGEVPDAVAGEHEILPRIVIVVDELADLMLTVGREIEELLTRLAQKARASGIHLILATQRPSVNVITGLIKANFPARVSFKVASKIDARTVLDSSGAEKLLGQGDMLFSSPSVGRLQRLHSPYVSDNEVHDVVDWIKSQGAPDYDESIEKMIAKADESDGSSSGGSGSGGDDEYDQFYDEAVSLVVEKGQASTSMVQRAFRIGYNRAARILETMEREGVVGPSDGAKPRQVLLAAPDEMM